jgi:cell shape-determining protein MreC
VQLASTTALLADRDVLYAENLELKSRLGRPGVAPRRILAGVMLRPPATPYDSLVIDAGAAEGVVEGDIVSAGGTVVVGSISEVYEHMARVTLYSAPGNEYEALLNGTLPTTLSGQGGGSLVAQVPAGTTVAEGDTAVLPGITGGLVAKVRGIERGTGESFVTLYFSLAVDALNLRYVEVWKQ